MEISIFALEKLILENKENISNCKKQLADLNSGKTVLSSLKQASIENTLERSSIDLENYLAIYEAIPASEKEKFKELQRVQEALQKQSYYKLQKIRMKKSLNITRNQRLEAMMIVDELPESVNFEDKQLIEISEVVIKNNIREAKELEDELVIIKKDFDNEIAALQDNKDLKHFAFLDSYIPIIVLHFKTFIDDIINEIEKYNEEEVKKEDPILKTFSGLPKYEDWWIEELFRNHQAYFALYKWKDIISGLCLTKHEKIIWEKLFNNWLMIKKILNSKEENAFDYNLIFDNMIFKYAKLDEELDINNLKSMEKIIYNITKKEDFTKTRGEHELLTTYLQWKTKKQLNNNHE